MMRLTWVSVLVLLISTPAIAQQSGRIPDYAQTPPAQRPAGQAVANGQPRAAAVPQAQVARQQAQAAAPQAAPKVPFEPLDANAQAQLQQLLRNWEAQSKGTKTLECGFKRWHFDMFKAPAGVHATIAEGMIKYASPDKGLFRVDSLLFFTQMEAGKPQYKALPGKFGEHWVCNGEQLIEFDRTKEECRIQDLPPNLRGQQIFNSPLPFVFNLDAQQIQQRYWVRQVAPPQGTNVLLIEAWPKKQEDRAQYKLVQIALDPSTYLPKALIMYAPNFDAKTAPRWDHYEFVNVKRNSIGAGFNKFIGNFIPEKPPASWKILRDTFTPPVQAPNQQANAAGNPAVR